MSKIYGQITGQGPAVVLLHGFCETHHIWKELGTELSPEYTVFSPDLPGFGDSPLPPHNFSLELIADLLRDWLKKSDISSCTMIGHSLGGYVTLTFAKKYPQMLEKIGLFHSSVYEDSIDKKSIRDKTINFINKNGVEVFVDSFFQNLFYPPNLERPYIQAKLKAIAERAKLLKASAVTAYLEAMRDRKDSRTWISAFPGPILMIAGTEDSAVPIESSREQSKLTSVIEFHELTGTAHMGMFEKKKEAFDIVKHFLSK